MRACELAKPYGRSALGVTALEISIDLARRELERGVVPDQISRSSDARVSRFSMQLEPGLKFLSPLRSSRWP